MVIYDSRSSELRRSLLCTERGRTVAPGLIGGESAAAECLGKVAKAKRELPTQSAVLSRKLLHKALSIRDCTEYTSPD